MNADQGPTSACDWGGLIRLCRGGRSNGGGSLVRPIVPEVYKRLPEVLAAHSGTVNVLHTLTPLGVAMAGLNKFDPYKD